MTKNTQITTKFISATRKLSKALTKIDFSSENFTVYNPLDYAKVQNEFYISKYLKSSVKYILVGMNPGPFGMAQTGIPFGDVEKVRTWLKITGDVLGPKIQHPKRPITGFECTRREVSGSRLWGWAEERFNSSEIFFKSFFVWNYCPLVFMEGSGANKTPDKLPPALKDEVFAPCDICLRELINLTGVEKVVGVGKFARKRIEAAAGDLCEVGDILHPSPANPRANRNWVGEIEKQLYELGCL